MVLVRIVDGELKKGQKIRMMASDALYTVEQIGVFRPKKVGVERLGPGEVGFITAQIKQVADTKVGDTITDERVGTPNCPVSLPAQQVVFCICFRGRGAVRRSARRAEQAASQRRRFIMKSNPRRWVSASAAASWGCCIWRSCERLEREFNWNSSPRRRQ